MRSATLASVILALLVAGCSIAPSAVPHRRYGGVISPTNANLAGSYNHNLASGTSATMVVESPYLALGDTDRFTPTANATITSLASTAMADTDQILFKTTFTGTAYTVTFSPGSGVTFKTLMGGDSAATVGQVCSAPATGTMWHLFQWDATAGTLTLRACGTDPPASELSTSLGGTGLNSITQYDTLTGGASAVNLVAPGSTQGMSYQSNGSSAQPSFLSNLYDVCASIPTTPSTSTGQVFDSPPRTVHFPANLASGTFPAANSTVNCQTAPTTSDTYTLYCGSTAIATIAVSTTCSTTSNGSSTFATTGGTTQSCSPPNQLYIKSPGTVYAEAGLSMCFAGYTP